MKIKYILIFLFFAGLISSCYYDNKEELYPTLPGSCDTTLFDYSTAVQSILANNCYACHSSGAAASSGGNIVLEGYSQAKTVAEDGRLLGSIAHASGYSAMPKGGAKLDDCSLLVIEKWIENNFPE
jgi:mono/diheme cytochrome c family protein